MTDMALIPLGDYQAAADQARTLGGTSAVIRSGELPGVLEAANTEVTAQTGLINELIAQANSLPDAGSGGGSSIAPETCSAYIEVYSTGFMIVYTVIENGNEVTREEKIDNIVDVTNLKKGSLVTVYAPGNSNDSVTGSAEAVAASVDYICMVYLVTGDCQISVL